MKKHILLLSFITFSLLLSALLLTGCGADAPESPAAPTGEESAAEESPSASVSSEEGTLSDADYVFPKTKPFVDDTGKPMQRDGDYLYSYCDGRLMRSDKENGETTLLYRTSSKSRLRFCFYGDFIYFVERAAYDSPDDRDTALYRMDKDGGNLTLLQDDILNVAPLKFITYWGEGKYDIDEYDIDIYDDIIYLLNYTYRDQREDEEIRNGNLYYKLESDGSVSEIKESDTLYGRLPKGFYAIRNPDRPMLPDCPSLPYFMRNYGYLFVRDSQDMLWRIDPANGFRENLKIAIKDNYIDYAFSGDTILLYSYAGGSLSLFRLSDKVIVPTYDFSLEDAKSRAVFPEEQGFYYCGKYYSDFNSDEETAYFFIRHILPDGSQNTIFYCTLPDENQSDLAEIRYDSCLFGNYFYYFKEEEMQHSLMRLTIKGYSVGDTLHVEHPVIQKADSWSVYPAASAPAGIVTKEKEEKVIPGNSCSVSYSIKELFLEEQTDADKLINQVLTKKAYTDFEEYIEDTIQNQQLHINSDPDFYKGYRESVDFSLDVTCDYMDDDTISFCCAYYEYFSDTVHSSHWCYYYTFDRHTGKRLSFEDFIDDTDLILSAATPYVEKKADWGFSPECVLEPERFALSEDGYTLHFSPYEIGPYAYGHIMVTVPYEAFEKEP